MEKHEFIRIALEQLKWEEFRRGRYSDEDGIRALRYRLYDMRDKEILFEFSEDELKLLNESVFNSMNKISGYNYGEGFTYQQMMKLRNDSLQPLSEFYVELMNMKKQ